MNFSQAVSEIRKFANGDSSDSYSEMYAKIFNQLLSEDEARKRYYGMVKLVDMLDGDLDSKTMQMVRDERADAKNKFRQAVRFDRLEDIIARAVETLPPLPPVQSLQPEKGCDDKVGILQVSDWHYGLETHLHQNHFDTATAFERARSLFQTAKNFYLSQNVSTVYVLVQGDLISGNIHNILRLQNQENLVTQIMGVSELLAENIHYFSQFFQNVCVVFIGGNHERVTPKKDDALAEENYIKLVAWFIEERLRGDTNIDFLRHKDLDSCYLQVLGKNIGVIHGDRDPFEKAETGLIRLYGVKFDFVFTSHNHHTHYEDIGYCRVISNGCLSGVDEYAKDLRALSYASQNACVLNSKGELLLYPILLS